MTDAQITATLRRAATRAVLAPSVHNTQPWTFAVRPGALEIRADRRRQLRAIDADARQLMISCGCAVFNARVAVAAARYYAAVERFPDPSQPDLLARLTVTEPAPLRSALGALDDSIELRRTNRRRFGDEPVPLVVIQELMSAAQAEGAELVAVASSEHREAAARLSQQADDTQNSDPAYLAELQAWTTDDLRRSDGVQAGSVPYAGAGPPENPLPVRAFDTHAMGWLPADPHSGIDQCLLLLGTLADERAAWLRAGEALERVWLQLTRLGYAASPLTQVTEVRHTRDQLRQELQLDMYPHVLLRVGRAPETIKTRRRPASEMISEG